MTSKSVSDAIDEMDLVDHVNATEKRKLREEGRRRLEQRHMEAYQPICYRGYAIHAAASFNGFLLGFNMYKEFIQVGTTDDLMSAIYRIDGWLDGAVEGETL
jgi:hypothetical protein